MPLKTIVLSDKGGAFSNRSFTVMGYSRSSPTSERETFLKDDNSSDYVLFERLDNTYHITLNKISYEVTVT